MLAAGPPAAENKHQGPAGCRLYLAAAEQGYLPAMCRVAACFHKGQGCLTDPGLARHWYRQVREVTLKILTDLFQGFCICSKIHTSPRPV